jgi:hypothetical protein
MRRNRLFTILFPACLLLGAASVGTTWLTACGNSTTSGSGSGGDCFDYSTIDLTTPTVSFKTDVLPIFRQSCGLSTSCHGSPTGGSLGGQHFYGPSNSAPAPSAADIQAIMDQSVGKASTANPDMVVIKAGDPAASFMMYKLDGDPLAVNGVTCEKLTCAADMSCLLAMPSGGPQLPETSLSTIRRWIAQGAKND